MYIKGDNMKVDLKNVTADTWARTVVLFLALANQMLAIFGKGQIAITEDEVYQLVSVIATIIATLSAWWKNNSFTQAAQVSDQMMKDIKCCEKEDGEATGTTE